MYSSASANASLWMFTTHVTSLRTQKTAIVKKCLTLFHHFLDLFDHGNLFLF